MLARCEQERKHEQEQADAAKQRGDLGKGNVNVLMEHESGIWAGSLGKKVQHIRTIGFLDSLVNRLCFSDESGRHRHESYR